ncbi:MAG: hypothetical protein D3916_02975 [Candidatus Electrothrix sp. MAN1_4]|nr:hypothetical protein [Candidatus Electrothrix sp. MAN1_4]
MSEAPEDGYDDFLAAENSLEDTTPRLMSELTQKLLRSIDYKEIYRLRVRNFKHLHGRLENINDFNLSEKEIGVPLCYPFMTKKEGLKNYLISKRVFLPTYWKDSIQRLNKNWSEKMITCLLPLPVDQRYNEADMDYLASLIEAYQK